MKRGLIVLGVVVVLLVMVGSRLMASRNQLVTEKNDIDARWAQVDNDMKRRADLIPNLVETVKGYAKQEQTVIAEVANARSALLGAKSRTDEMAANNQLGGAIGRLLVLRESYPELKSNENFLRLQDELAGTENRIAVDRRRYNDTLQDYNTYIQQFPHNVFAGWTGFKPNDAYFAASEGSREAPKVNFSTPNAAPQATPAPAPAR